MKKSLTIKSEGPGNFDLKLKKTSLITVRNSNQVCDDIYSRQYKKLKESYSSQLSKSFDPSQNDSPIRQLIQRALNKGERNYEIDKEFRQMDYMKFLQLKDKSMMMEDSKAVNEKLKGRFMLRIQ